ncbi:mechanosensitive ion channel [Flavobacterium sp. NST-5]|uniref:Mechanosensitive ion channel n=1 Tax=Flavobacterium ichthyis TaxID=2698827 RepID=A0ABW9Z8D6_9FLAO|nr:mechanosensitive ion channel [Flavobacterium ichthyis]NBL64370.1 mechanosensitive ion channel [Flavobacterium ichthyis]
MDFEKMYDLISEKLINWADDFIRMLPNIALAATVLVLGLFLSKILKNFIAKLLSKVSPNPTLTNLFTSIVHFTLIGISFFIALSILKLDKAVTSILAGAGIIGLALAFAFQDIAANFISGIFISFRRPIAIGQIVKISDYMGKVIEINLRDTVLMTFQGQMVIIPNKNVFQNPIENYSMLGKRRFDLSVGVSYGEDLERVQQITLDALKNMEGLSDIDETSMFYTEFGDSSINYTVRIWINTPEQPSYLAIGNKAIIAIKKAYDANGISIPFPIRTLDFGIKGGKSLDEIKLNIPR